MTNPAPEPRPLVDRKWAYAQGGAACAMLVCWWIMKGAWPSLSLLFIAVCLVHLVGAGLCLASHSSARAFLVYSASGILIFGAVVSTGLLSLGAFIWSVFGDPGYDALTDLVLLASVIYVLLEPYEVVKLRMLTHPFPGGPRRWMRRYTVLTLLPLLVPLGVWFWASDDDADALTEQQAELSLSYLRATVEQRERPNLDPLSEVHFIPEIQLYVSFHRDGQLVARVSGSGNAYSEALEGAGRALVNDPRFLGYRTTDGVLTIHRVTEVRTLPADPRWLGIWVDPSRHGVMRGGQGGSQVILPDVLQRRPAPDTFLEVPGFFDIQMGVNGHTLSRDLNKVGGPMERLLFEEITEKE